jgi:putative DNA methylase
MIHVPGKGSSSKKDLLRAEIARAVNAGLELQLKTVDFSDPGRPPTCLEVDFPILPINQVATIEGNAGKPIYQMSKWWARRRSSVFRSLLLAAGIRAPEDPSQAAKQVWDAFYANHQKKGSFRDLKVADIFMGGGTTLIEASRLGMQAFGNDLNPVAWFVVKQELAKVDVEEVKALLADIEAEVKPQVMPYFCCDGPGGEKGEWRHKPTNRTEGPDFDPLSIPREKRGEYSYSGPEIIYTFWAKHGPCQVTGCGHRTPLMASAVIAVKTLTVKCWDFTCPECGNQYRLEAEQARMAPDAPLYVDPGEGIFAALSPGSKARCPLCGKEYDINPKNLGKGTSRKVSLSLLVRPQWLAGSPGKDEQGWPYGGSAQDNPGATARWNVERARTAKLMEVRGELPGMVEDPDTGKQFDPMKGTLPKTAKFECGRCGTVQPIVTAMEATGKTAPASIFSYQGYSTKLDNGANAYNGRFFGVQADMRQYDGALREWEERKDADLKDYWPRSVIPFGHMTHQRQPLPQHGYRNWSDMFNPRQLLVHAQLLKVILTAGDYSWDVREYVLGAFQNFVRNENTFAFWHMAKDHFAPALSNDNFHPKLTTIEVGAFSNTGYGPWPSTIQSLLDAAEWKDHPWDTASVEYLQRIQPDIAKRCLGKGEKVFPGDNVGFATIWQGSSTDLSLLQDKSHDLVITDPPFAGLLHYSELSDFFHVWLRLALKDRYPDSFGPEYTPKSLEVVANKAREPDDPDGFYKRLLTGCWREAHRILKPAGILAFTFHHSEDAPWVAVLESLFDAGFYLEATYPIRGDETKGEGEFGSKTIEYDIIHVCRKRTGEPKPVSWGRMRREVLADVRNLQAMLENHASQGLPAADLQVIRRGKALEYYSRHFGKVFIDQDRIMDVREALIGINQIIDEDGGRSGTPLPPRVEPMTRHFLRIFRGTAEVARDQMQKYLKGSGISPDEFVQRGWCQERDKAFFLADPLAFAHDWKGEKRSKLSSDLDQALFLIGACTEGSGIDASATLENANFRPHVALRSLLEHLSRSLAGDTARNAASRAHSILRLWEERNRPVQGQMDLFGEDEA